MTSATLPVTFGTQLRHFEFQGFRVTEAVYAPRAVIAAHEHAFASWTAVLSGSIEERFGRGVLSCSPGTLLSKPATAVHTDNYGPEGARALIVEIRDPERAFAEFASDTLGDVRLLQRNTAGSVIRRMYAELTTRERGWELAAHSLMLDIAQLLVRVRTRTPRTRQKEWLRTVQERLHAEFAHPPSLESLARSAGIHPVYLCQAFRNQFGCSPRAYVRRLRLERAKELLTRSLEPVSTIAFGTGFSDQSHLTRQFRAAFGVTPAKYRSSQRH